VITIGLNEKATALVTKLGGFPLAMREAIIRTADRQNELTVGGIKRNRATGKGPFPVSEGRLGVVSGRYRQSIRRTPAVFENGAVVSTIGSNVKYAGAHEFGFDGVVNVKSFIRRNPRADLYKIKGFLLTGAQLDAVTASRERQRHRRARVASGLSMVKASSRRMKIPARAPIRYGISDRRSRYSTALSSAVINAWKQEGVAQ
jgi:hypothetical protein